MKKVSTMIAFFLLAFTVVTTAQAQTVAASRAVISPYYQADSNGGVYTFIGVSHPSLSGSASQIGLRLTAVGATVPTSANAYLDFTVSAGNTQRVFIVVTNHSSVNTTGITDSASSFIATSGNVSGFIRAASSNLLPLNYIINSQSGGSVLNNLSQLSFWGAIVATSTSTGFAMEFIGDAHDSVARVETTGVTSGRGIN